MSSKVMKILALDYFEKLTDDQLLSWWLYDKMDYDDIPEPEKIGKWIADFRSLPRNMVEQRMAACRFQWYDEKE